MPSSDSAAAVAAYRIYALLPTMYQKSPYEIVLLDPEVPFLRYGTNYGELHPCP